MHLVKSVQVVFYRPHSLAKKGYNSFNSVCLSVRLSISIFTPEGQRSRSTVPIASLRCLSVCLQPWVGVSCRCCWSAFGALNHVCDHLAELEHDTSLPIMDSYDKSSLFGHVCHDLSLFAMIYHGRQWFAMCCILNSLPIIFLHERSLPIIVFHDSIFVAF